MYTYSWTLPFIFFIIGYFGTHIWLVQSTQSMPNFIGMPVHEALEISTNATLNLRLLGYKHDPDIAPGTILSQMPRVGTIVKPHQSVFIVVAQSPTLPSMPEGVQHSVADIQRICEKQGIIPMLYYIPHIWPAGMCFAQYPRAYTTLQKNTVPIFYISSGIVHKVIWPTMVGLPVQEAIDLLAQKGISAHIIAPNNDIKKTIAYVNKQRPLAGSIVDITKPETVAVQLEVTYAT
ncbi:MAG TPA: PASTA domain-containing protein [Candidatus Babeliales bacterium]|nr:PASTA domain-containing protein [Candidatus Babeliales bacterium]